MKMRDLQRKPAVNMGAARLAVMVVFAALVVYAILGGVLSLVAVGAILAGAFILWACGLAPWHEVKERANEVLSD